MSDRSLNIPMDLLRSFVAVADLGGFTKAAESLCRSQPAISLQIKRLEEIVDAPLLRRAGRRLEVTERGQTLLVYARQILCVNDEAVSRLFQQEVTGSVRVGLPNDFAVSFLPEILAKFSTKNADVALDVECELSKDLFKGLRAGRYDVILAMTADAAPLPVAKVWRERLAWVTGPNGVTWDSNVIPIIVYPEGCIYRRRMVDSLSRAGQAWRAVYCSPSLSGIYAALKAGLGVTVLSEHTAPRDLSLLGGESGFPGLEDVDVGLYYMAENLSSPALRLVNHFVAYLDEVHDTPNESGSVVSIGRGSAPLRFGS